ncbi:MAG: YjgP/YjgQ family permease [Candidatus Abyssobacteria bacterium SURF_5]|uniref:YjgP/YjgQ family permease n=1 Tax=Abyssobacteria bacterium (strain SURF_5) TaxID=2093360 RepID=A0A3A4NXB8_ABYX5|nr:MAG: YjgP/YjgQ family permease [Candidatus Abyssubacteria bacterium SURF_5]
MSILTRYICRRVLLYYFSFLLIMLAFFIFVDFMENIDRLTKHQAPLSLLSLYYLCLTPRVLIEISWISFLVSILFVFGGLVKNNEMAALLSGGISVYSVAVPILAIGVILYLCVFIMQEFLVPRGMLTANELDENKFLHKSGPQISDVAGFGRRNLFYYFDLVDTEQGVLSGVHIHHMKDGFLTERIDAEEAIWDTASERWYLENGTVKKFDAEGALLETTAFVQMKAPFKESPKTLQMHASEEVLLGARGLHHQIKNLERSGYDAQRLKVQYYSQFAVPAANIIVIFLALPFALECRRGGLATGFALSLIAALLYYGTFQIGMTLGKGGSLPAVLSAWLANILFFGIGAALTIRART